MRDLQLTWRSNFRGGRTHREWTAPCGCSYHPEPHPHVYRCAEHGDPVLDALERIYTAAHALKMTMGDWGVDFSLGEIGVILVDDLEEAVDEVEVGATGALKRLLDEWSGRDEVTKKMELRDL